MLVVILAIIGYLVIGGLVARLAYRHSEDLRDEAEPGLTIGLMVFWPFVIIVVLIVAVATVIHNLVVGSD